jgi:hypothetical protein
MDLSPYLSSLLMLLGTGAVGVSTVAGGRVLVQRNADVYRRRYLLTVPPGKPFTSLADFLDGLGGISGTGNKRLMGMASVVFETVSDGDGIRNYLVVPGSKELSKYIVGQARSSLGASLIFANSEDYEPWDEVIEVGLSNSTTPLPIDKPEAVVKRILTAMSTVGEGEAKLLQWVVTSAEPPYHTKDDKYNDLPIFVGVGRIAARAADKTAARQLIREVFESLRSLKAYGVSFYPRQIPSAFLMERTYRKASVLRSYCTLNKTELGAVIGIPCGELAVPGLPQGRTKNLPVDPKIPEGPFVYGMSDFSGMERAIGISAEDRLMHTYIPGPTGSGKTTWIENAVLQDWEQGFGNVVIDPHGDLTWRLLDIVPMDRAKDVIVIDPTDASMPVGFNILTGENAYLTTQNVMGVLDGVWPGLYNMPRTSDILRAGILTLAQQGLTLMDLSLLIDSSERGKDFRAWVMKGMKGDQPLKQFWREFDGMKPTQHIEATGPVMRRLRQIELWPSLRAMLGQKDSGFDFEQVIANNKIVLVSLNRRMIGEETAKLVGAMLVTKLWHAAQGRSAIAPNDRKPFFCYIDEAHNFFRLPINLTDALAEARKYGLGFILAHQDLTQLDPRQRDAIMSNCRSKIIFQPAASDAAVFARELTPYLQAQDLQNLSEHQVVVKLVRNGQVAPPTTATTFPPPKGQGTARSVREASRQRHGRPMAEVERELAQRQQVFKAPPAPPPLGVVEEDE